MWPGGVIGNGYGVGLATERSRVRSPAGPLSGNNFGQVVNTRVPRVTKQYNLVPYRSRVVIKGCYKFVTLGSSC